MTMSVYDLKGKLVYKSVLDKSDLDNLTFGSEFPEGLYQLFAKMIMEELKDSNFLRPNSVHHFFIGFLTLG